MSDDALVYEDDRDAEVAGVHAIVIGIGHYRHLPGGEGNEATEITVRNFDQLSSPPISARRIGRWIIDTYADDQDRPLRSLSVLISDRGGPATFSHLLCPQVEVPDATIDNLRDAIKAWKDRGDANADNLMVFYICCHGITAGPQHTLIASDFGADEDDLFRHAIDFTQLHQGMAKCEATRQVYFVDACRELSEDLLLEGSKGTPIISSNDLVVQTSAPVFRSSLADDKAWTLVDVPTPFAEAIPRAFEGAAWRKEGGRWVVCSSQLKLGIEAQIRSIMRNFPRFPSLIDRDLDVTMTLKEPDSDRLPHVPIDVSCEPEEANEFVELSFVNDSTAKSIVPPSRTPSRLAWLLDLPYGVYKVSATFANGGYFNEEMSQMIVAPPNGSERIGVRKQ